MARHTKVRVLFFLVFLCAHISQIAKAQRDDNLTFSFGSESSLLKLDWKYNSIDNPIFSEVNYNDSEWVRTNSALYIQTIKKINFKGFGWFRASFKIDSSYKNLPLVFEIDQTGASEIYINGKLLEKVGIINGENSIYHNGTNRPVFFIAKEGVSNVIAIRYLNNEYDRSYENGTGLVRGGFKPSISSAENYWTEKNNDFYTSAIVGIGTFVFLFSIGLVHFLLFIFYRVKRTNLLFSAFCALLGYYFLHFYLTTNFITNPSFFSLATLFVVISAPFFFLLLLSVLYSLFYEKTPKTRFYLFITCCTISASAVFLPIYAFIGLMLLIVFILVEMIRVLIVAIKKRKKGFTMISFGFGIFAITIVYIVLTTIFQNGSVTFETNSVSEHIFIYLIVASIISIPLSMSTFLAWDFSQTSKSLSKKLVEVEELSTKSIEQEKEKQKILAEQNEKLERQVTVRTKEIFEQKSLIEEKNKDITDSINYAKRIQDATLPSKELKSHLFPQAFVLFKPKDVVSGDFYWFAEVRGTRFIAAADCTGHGVPGALVSVICSTALNRAVKEFTITEPGKILDKVRELVLETFGADKDVGGESHVQDGMDISLCVIPSPERGSNDEKTTIKWAGANNPFWYVQQNQIKEIKANKQPIGKTDKPLPFTTHVLELNKGDIFYLFTDGYADQFGGPKGKKFKYKQLEELFLEINNQSMPNQEEVLIKTFDEWKQSYQQIDDVLVIGVKV